MSASRDVTAGYAAALRTLLSAVHLMPPDELPELAGRSARALGASEAVIYLIDYEQRQLVPVPAPGTVPRAALAVDATVAGRAFRSVEPQETEAGASRRL